MIWPTEAERHARLHKRAGYNCTEEAMPMDPDEVRKKHRSSRIELTPNVTICLDGCGRDWPCDAIQLLDEVERLLTDMAAQKAEIAKLREALEAIADGHTPYRMDKEKYFMDAALQFRDTARVALGKPPSEKGESDD